MAMKASWLVDVDGQDRLLALGKTEWVLDGWISERALGMIEDESGVTPGDLRLRGGSDGMVALGRR